MSKPDVTEDAFLGGRVMVRQPKSGYRAGLDAVFLAASVQCESTPECRILDVGAGVGTVGLCVAARCRHADVTLLERDPQLAALAAVNVALNNCEGRVRVVNAGVGSAAGVLALLDVHADGFDAVLANPPYHAEGRGTAAPDPLKAMSHAMPDANLDDWVRFMARMVKSGGTATMVHKADALALVLAAFGKRFGDVRVLPLHPRAGEPASRVIVQGIKGSRAPMALLQGRVLHGEGNGFTAGAQMILREGAGMPLRA
ncbi:MAG: methyltransferase [Hyphomicrobiaceae bacterium]